MSKAKAFSLDSIPSVFQEFQERKQAMKEHKAWIDEATGILKRMAGDATEFTLGGQTVATLVAGQLNLSLLSSEQPELVKEYTRIVADTRFDVVAFAAEHPELFEQYRAQRLVLSTKPHTKGLDQLS